MNALCIQHSALIVNILFQIEKKDKKDKNAESTKNDRAKV